VELLHAAADPRSEETAPGTSEKRGCSDGLKTSTRCACTMHRKELRCFGPLRGTGFDLVNSIDVSDAD
jgi:hypothetical protein